MKKMPAENRKITTSFALSPQAMRELEEICEESFPQRSRSYALEAIIHAIHEAWIGDQKQPEEFPDEFIEVGYNPFTGAYEEDL